MGKQVGKVKWFDAKRSTGVLTTIGGKELRFTSRAKRLTKGQIVSFEAAADVPEARADPVALSRVERRRLGGRRADDVSRAEREPPERS